MKKLMSLSLVLMLAITCLASCYSNLPHQHFQEEKWSFDSEMHWKEVTCIWNVCKTNYVSEEHYDNDGDYICDACGYVIKIGGAFEFEYVASEEGHCEHKVGTACDGTCVKSPHEDKDNDFQCDYCKYLLDTSDVAQIVFDYEQGLRDELAKLRAEHPEYNFYYHPVAEVHCVFVLDREASADAIVAKYDMENLFASSSISALNAIKMVSVTFDRNDFTEDMHRKIKQISEDEALVENLFVDMYRDWYQSYMPRIEYYTDDASVLKYEIAPYILGFENARDIIIKSKAEYDAYLNELSETEEYDYQKERINAAKERYDEAFFEENVLILTRMVVRGSGSIQLTINNLYVSDNKVYVVIRTDEPINGTDDMQYAFFGFVVDKDDVVNVNEVVTLD